MLVMPRPFHAEGVVVELSRQAPELVSALPTWCNSFALAFPIDSSEWWAIRELSVDALLQEPDLPLGHWLPALPHLRVSLIDREDVAPGVAPLERRVHNALLEQLLGDRVASTWGDLARFTVKEISAIRGLGATGTRDAVRFLVDLGVRIDPDGAKRAASLEHEIRVASVPTPPAAEAEARNSPDASQTPAVTHDVEQSVRLELQAILAPLSRVVAWAAVELGPVTIVDALRAASQGAAPDDVKEAAQIVERAKVPVLPAPNVAALIDAFLEEELSWRHRFVFEARVLKPQDGTLEEVGAQLEITRERVRQIEQAALRDALRALSSEKYRVLRWRSHTLRTMLGPLFPDGHPAVVETMERVLGCELKPLYRSFLLWAAGPYDLTNGLWGLERSRVRKYLEVGILQATDEFGVPEEALLAKVVEYGVPEQFAAAVLSATPKLHKYRSRYFSRKPTIPDQCAMALDELGRPASIVEIAELIESDGKRRNLLVRVQSDERFIRVSKDEYALRDWGLEEYSGITDAMAKLIAANGGSAHTDQLVREIPGAFGVSPTSVRMYFDAPMFVVEGDTIRLRREDEGFKVDEQLPSRRGVFRFGHRVTLLLDINKELMRGSGKPLASDIVQVLGAQPGIARIFNGDGFDVGVHWPRTSWSGGSLGSMRAAIAAAGVKIGQQLRLTFDLDSSRVESVGIDLALLDSMLPLNALRHLTGVDASTPEEAIAEVDSALGTSLIGPAALLRARGDAQAASLIERLEHL